MKYNLHQKFITSENVLEPRSYYIPFSEPVFSHDLSKSKEVTVLDKWKFNYYPSFNDEIINEEPTKEYKVPFNWQREGFDYDQYLNTDIAFPFEPPYILKDIPCGVYLTNYQIDKKEGKYYINFDGVDSCLYLFVNDKYVGYASISHSPNEFDITNVLFEGNNKIKVVVLKWCAGSYLEVQDKLRMSGIFREVYILNRPDDHIVDYKIIPNKNGEIHVECDKGIDVALFDKDELLDKKSGKVITFCIKDPKLWTAETPYLYRLVLSYNGEYIEEYIGLRTIEIRNAVLLVNNKPIKFRGVNRHSSTVNGYVESIDDLINDLKLFKKFNINAVRTSHYPPHPLFPKLCDEYGIYVLLECDLECHEAAYVHNEKSNFSSLSTDKRFEDMYFNRLRKGYERDKNRSSVVVWSLGNESGFSLDDGGYSNFTRGAEYIRSKDCRPIHYEGSYLQSKDGEWYHRKEQILSMYSRMYPPYRDLDRFVNGFYTKDHLGMEERPFILCEYSHAMGNSCGDVKYFWDNYINKYPQFCGGFIWEWNNHGVYKDGKFLTGPDFNTDIHSGNFCADGLVDLDRKFLHSALYEVSEAYSPFDVKYENGKFRIFNMKDFTDLGNYSCKVIIEENGVKKEEFIIDIKNIAPKCYKEICIPSLSKYNGYVTSTFILNDKKWGMESFRQIIISSNYPIKKYCPSTINKNIEINDNGLIKQIFANGKELLNEPMELVVYRAPTDNDSSIDEKWRACNLNKAKYRAVDVKRTENGFLTEGFLCYDNKASVGKINISYQFYDEGVKVCIHMDVNDFIPALPRFGVRFALKNDFCNVTYFGAGEIESYEDKHAHSPISLYSATVDSLYVPYTRPQESGSHAYTRFIEINNNNNQLFIESEKDFSFNISNYNFYHLPYHSYELKKDDNIYLIVDYRQASIGSMSCNHPLNEQFTYTITEKQIHFCFYLRIGSIR